MSHEDIPMPSSSWKYLSSAGSRLTSLKGYITNHRESAASASASGSSSWRSSPGPGGHGRTPNLGQEGSQLQPQSQVPEGPGQRQSWRAWAGQKIRAGAARRRAAHANGGNGSTELVNVFPGWAVRRYNNNYADSDQDSFSGSGSQAPRPFDLEVFISGYAITHRSPENMSRAQRGFLRLAKGFASLPKLIDTPSSNSPNSELSNSSSQLTQLTPSTEALLSQVNLPPRPTEITDDYDVEALERQLRKAKNAAIADWRDEVGDDRAETSSASSSSSRSSTLDLDVGSPGSGSASAGATVKQSGFNANASTLKARAGGGVQEPRFPPAEPSPHNSNAPTTQEMIRRLHANLERRLQPFWSSVLPNRTVRLYLFASPHQKTEQSQRPPVSSSSSFSSAASSPSPMPSPNSSHSQNSNTNSEIDINALLSDAESTGGPLASQDVLTAADGSFQVRFRVNWEDLCLHPKALHIAFGEPREEHELLILAQLIPPLSPSPAPSPSSSRLSLPLHGTPSPEQPAAPQKMTSLTRVPLHPSPVPIRVISDIDDTVKFSGILAGARAVFHNVFVKDLRDSVIPGMGEWYTQMWSRGVRFHYVSNGPFELLPVINEFFELSQLPPGSIKLRSYAGRSLFNGLLSAPAARKRAGVVDILDSFPESKFFLIGDTGEQDMELYADIARERPHQILGVFVRDADAFTYNGPEPLEDPTGWKAVVSGAAGTRPSGRPLVHSDSSSNTKSSKPNAPSRSDSAMTGVSVSSDGTAWERYNYGATGVTERGHDNEFSQMDSQSPLEPPRPQFWSDGAGAHENWKRQSRIQGHQNFGIGNRALSAEPEPLVDVSTGDDSRSGETPTMTSSARVDQFPSSSAPGYPGSPSQSTPTPQHSSKFQEQQQQPQYITEPPPPTPPPSSSASFPYFSSSSSSQLKDRYHQMNASTSSLSSGASTTNVNLYGYVNASPRNATANPAVSGNSKKGSTSSTGSAGMTEAEKKRHELQLRVWRARTQIPPEVVLRVFRDPAECVEAGDILDREGS